MKWPVLRHQRRPPGLRARSPPRRAGWSAPHRCAARGEGPYRRVQPARGEQRHRAGWYRPRPRHYHAHQRPASWLAMLAHHRLLSPSATMSWWRARCGCPAVARRALVAGGVACARGAVQAEQQPSARPPGRRQRRVVEQHQHARRDRSQVMVLMPRASSGASLTQPACRRSVAGGRGARSTVRTTQPGAMAVRSPHRAAACRAASRSAEAGGRVRDVVPGRSRRRCARCHRNLEHGIRRARADQRIGEATCHAREQHHAPARTTARRGR